MADQTVKREASKPPVHSLKNMNLLVLGSGAAGKLTPWTPAKKGMNAANHGAQI